MLLPSQECRGTDTPKGERYASSRNAHGADFAGY